MRQVNDGGGNVAYMLDTDDNSLRETKLYWTPERMAGAIPFRPTGLSIPGPEGAAGRATDPEPADLAKMPFCAVGKLFFRDYKSDYYASAAIYGERGLLLTAAHCVQDSESGSLYDRFLFKRCYDMEKFVEELTLKTVALKAAWVGAGDQMWGIDYSVAVLNGQSALKTPLKHGQGNTQKVRAIGYPSNCYNGERMVFIDGNPRPMGTDLWFIDGDKMEQGCSGGPWLDSNGIVVGLNSFSAWSPDYKINYGGGSPRFDENFESLYQYALTLM